MNEPEKAGQESTRTPDFIPGWFVPRVRPSDPSDTPGQMVVDSTPREAVRWFRGTDFPIAFLRSSESVSPARPPQLGVTISQCRGDDFSLAVPPDYWIVRDPADRLYLANPDEFAERWVRELMDWTPKAPRSESVNPHLSPGAIEEASRIGIGGTASDGLPKRIVITANPNLYPPALLRGADFVVRNGQVYKSRGGDANRAATAEEIASCKVIEPDAARMFDLTVPTPAEEAQMWPKGSPERELAERGGKDKVLAEMTSSAEKVLADLADGSGWQGTPPAIGTRRHLILAAITDRFPGYTAERRLELADTIESALLQDTINEEADRKAGEIIASGIVKVDPDAPAPGYPVTEGGLRTLIDELRSECAQADDRHAAALIRLEGAEKQLEGRESDAQEAIGDVLEALDRIDAPQAPTAAGRIDRLFTEFRNKVEVANVRGRIDKGKAVDYDRVHNLLDGWEIRREDDDEATRSLLERAREFVERLRRTEEDLDTEQHRVARIPAKDVRPGTRELHIVVADDHTVDVHRTLFIELEDQGGRGVGGFERRPGTPGTERIVIPYGRDDEWVQRVAMAAIVAGQDADKPFPPNALDSVLEEFGVEPTMPRTWPHRDGETSAFEKALQEIPAHFKDAEVNAARRVFDELTDDDETEPDHGNRWMATAEGEEGLTDNERRLYDQREEARAGEGRFAEERDCAYALLRWLLPVVVGKRVD